MIAVRRACCRKSLCKSWITITVVSYVSPAPASRAHRQNIVSYISPSRPRRGAWMAYDCQSKIRGAGPTASPRRVGLLGSIGGHPGLHEESWTALVVVVPVPGCRARLELEPAGSFVRVCMPLSARTAHSACHRPRAVQHAIVQAACVPQIKQLFVKRAWEQYIRGRATKQTF
jgi:hypothetical protein